MEILEYDPSMSGDVASAYNRVIRGVPHCYPVSAEQFAAGVQDVSGDAQSDRPLRSQAVLVAAQRKSILAFADAAVGYPSDQDQIEQGIIRFFWYEPGHRAVGQALLDAAEERLRRHNVDAIMAFTQHFTYRFYHLSSAYLSDHLGHVQAILGSNGYERVAGEVFLDWPDLEPVEPAHTEVQADISVDWQQGKGTRPNVTVKAHHGRDKLGECACESCGEPSSADEAQDWFFTTSLWVSEPVQGKGLGRHLLQRALGEMHGAGYRHAAISTAWHNYRAFLLYTNVGYHVVDWTYGLRRQLQPGETI